MNRLQATSDVMISGMPIDLTMPEAGWKGQTTRKWKAWCPSWKTVSAWIQRCYLKEHIPELTNWADVRKGGTRHKDEKRPKATRKLCQSTWSPQTRPSVIVTNHSFPWIDNIHATQHCGLGIGGDGQRNCDKGEWRSQLEQEKCMNVGWFVLLTNIPTHNIRVNWF